MPQHTRLEIFHTWHFSDPVHINTNRLKKSLEYMNTMPWSLDQKVAEWLLAFRDIDSALPSGLKSYIRALPITSPNKLVKTVEGREMLLI
jgi:hypothetical protein